MSSSSILERLSLYQAGKLMNALSQTNELLSACRRHVLSDDDLAVVPEPYIPYVPTNWNGLMVLAEAQNLSTATNLSYRAALFSMSPDERMQRLGNIEGVGIQPWDDGSLKLAVAAAFAERPNRTAASNAVLWSQVDSSGRNVTPSDDLVQRSVGLWVELLKILKPRRVITAGNLARDLFRAANKKLDFPHTALRLPSPLAMSRVSGMFSEADLRCRYPEVDAVILQHPEWLKRYKLNKVFFACHAVSLVRDGG